MNERLVTSDWNVAEGEFVREKPWTVSRE